MCKKTICMITMAAFCVFISSCAAKKVKKNEEISDAEMAYYLHDNGGCASDDTVIAAVVIVGVGAVYLSLLNALKSSCPFIYSYNGKKYVIDAEPYGGSICPALKRTEWCRLEKIEETEGQYKIRVLNELDETQYTDELKLVVVDHPKETLVAPAVTGEFYAFSGPVSPVKALENGKNDILALVSQNDSVSWETATENIGAENRGNLKDELIFEFPKPENSKNARLIVNACTSLWGSRMIREYLELYGNEVGKIYDKMANFQKVVELYDGSRDFENKSFEDNTGWLIKDELYRMFVQVETGTGWKTRAWAAGGGPFFSEDRVYNMDISDVKGTTLKIKLTPPANFWKINYVAVDYSESSPVAVKELSAKSAVDHEGKDVTAALANMDNNFLVMPYIGDSVVMTFTAPERAAETERSVFIKANGYYDIHLKETGKPQADILKKIHDEPGFSIRYAMKLYNNLKKDIASKQPVNENR